MHALLVDDNQKTLNLLTGIFRRHEFEVLTASSLGEARDALQRQTPEVAMINENVRDTDGISLLEHINLSNVMEIYVTSSERSLRSAVRAMRVGASDYFDIPVDTERLNQNLASLLEVVTSVPADEGKDRKVRKSGRGLLLGEAPAMQRLYRLVRKVAPTNVTVLISGESGTGKELVAQTVHQLSERRHHGFVAVNCAAVPRELMESELFGHVKGAFTGATRNHKGFFQRASEGTLFLDEITEMSPELQAKLLRVLETGIVHPVGSEKEIQTSPRIIAATNRDPEEAVEQGRLREDLYYRLAEFGLYVPALRERPQDIDLLALHFLEQRNEEGSLAKTISPEVMKYFKEHSWPGNVRELRSAVTRSHLLAGDEIIVDDLPGNIPAGSSDGRDFTRMPIGITLAECERRMLLSTLEHFDSDKKAAAKALGVSVKTIYNRLKKYGVR